MSAYIIISVLQAFAFLLIFLEILIPSGGLISILAIGCFGYSWYSLMEQGNQFSYLIFGLIDLICIPLSIIIGFKVLKKSPFINNDELGSEDGYMVDTTSALQGLIGKEGIVTSPLRPSGKIEIENELYEALSETEMLDIGTTIIVLTVSENKIIVEQKQPKV